MRCPQSYFILFNCGVRIWWNPQWWRFEIYDANWGASRVYSFGPITIYRRLLD